MSQPVIQHSFNSGEWAPALNARVDLQKYHQGAALLLNWFVDYRGGASTRTGTKYVLQCFLGNSDVRLIPFQASFSVSYILEFGDHYVRFFHNGAAVLESAIAITGITNANPAVVSVANTWNDGDWIFITGVAGMTQVNGKYFRISSRTAGTVTLSDLLAAPIDSTSYGVYTSGGTAARVYTIPSPYAASDLALLKYAQNVNTLVLCHTSYPPYILTLISAANWTLTPILFGATIGPPLGAAVTTTLAAGTVNYAYQVTSVDANGQESGPSVTATLLAKLDLRTNPGTNTVTWTPVTGAASYNVYKTQYNYAGAVPAGVAFGYIGNTVSPTFIDTNFTMPDFSLTPPIGQNPFQGAGVVSAIVTTPGVYTTVPSVTFTAAPIGGQTVTGSAVLQVQGTPTVNTQGTQYVVGQAYAVDAPGVFVVVAAVDGVGGLLAVQPMTFPGSNPGGITSGTTPANPRLVASTFGGPQATVNLVWGVGSISVINHGYGYTSPPVITFSPAGAVANATLGSSSLGNPGVPAYFNQRLVLAGPLGSPQTFYMSKPGAYYNFDISNPLQPDDSITGTLVSNQLNTIKSMIPMSTGLVTLSDRSAWQISGGGGSAGQTAAVDATNVSAQSHSYNGSTDVQPILATFDILYVQAKGSVVRDLSYNLYANVYTGTDISVLSSHLFYGYQITGWCFAEEPFKVVHAVRNDGTLLNLTFMKEQELIAWTHSATQGYFRSVASITETVSSGSVDAVYCVAQRTINGAIVKYVERFAERSFPNGVIDAWCVDAGLQYIGAPTTTFSGGEHLAGATVTGLANGVVIPPFVMPVSGNFTLSTPAGKVTVGLGYFCDLQTLQLDIGEPTIQGKMKQISAITVRCQDTLGLQIGRTFNTMVFMKDLVRGNVGSATNTVVADLVTGDAMTVIDASWTVPGQYCIRQSLPLPASVLGVIPQIIVGDTK